MVKYSAVAKTASNIHVIVGEDDYLVETTARKIRDAAVPAELRNSAVEVIAGEADAQDDQMAALRDCEASVQTPPFLDPVKLTWWRNVTFLPGGGKNGRLADRVKEALERFAKDLAAHPLPPNQHLVITAPKLLQTSIFAKTMKTVGEVMVYAAGRNSRDRIAAALGLLPELAKEEGLKFAPGVAEAFISKVGSDTRTILSELAKMRAYLGNETDTVTREAVTAISAAGGEAPELWTLTDAVGRRDVPAAAALLKVFLAQKSAGILLSTVLEKYFRDLCVYRDAIDQGWLNLHGWARNLPAEVVARLDATGAGPNAETRNWVARGHAAAARNFTARELRVARHRMMKVRERLVSSTSDDALVGTELLRILPKRG